MKSYYSDFPNQLHQLNVSLSKHLHLLKDGTIKHQSKKFDINFDNFQKSGKRHLVNYVIRDHFSGCYYAEIHPADKMPHIVAFLYNAWSIKKIYPFRGIPNHLSITRSIIDLWPHLINFDKKCDKCTLQLATSGFANGVVSCKVWEKDLQFFIYQVSQGWFDHIPVNHTTIDDFSRDFFDLACSNSTSNSGYEWEDSADTPIKKWLNNNPPVQMVEDPDDFLELFQPTKT